MTNIAQPQPNFRDAPYGLPNGLEVTTSVPVDSEEDMTVKERLLKKLAGVKNNVFRAMQRNDLAEEQAEKREKLLENLEQQYPRMVEVLETYEQVSKDMPTWDKIKEGLTPEVLDKALKLKEPALLLIPPTTRQLKVEALNKHKVEGQEHDTYTHDLKNDDLWHSGESEKNKKWIVAIVEGVQEVEADENIDPVQMTNHKMSKAWKEKFKSQGLDIMEGADAYLTLMMKSLQEGTPLDKKYWTVLNAKNSEQTSFVAGGGCGCDRVYLDYGYPSRSYHSLRARGSVRVDVPWNQ